ncbi:MAG: multidrug ABC transporter substrate-binding protein [Candidatus Rokubacteria bacterium RIFCSPLOWO2_12_FULL_71_19]|nr:MAG: multidrug ABC transporter substrate-binding protein [Candidatus Rokubacteria bacterium RIFCSPLOWO2_12_FULL_71_19]
MNILVGTRIALRALRANPLRSVLTMLGIIIGVGAVIAMVSVGAGAQERVAEQIRALGSNLIIVLPGSVWSSGIRMGLGSRPTVTEDDARAVAREVPAIQSVAPVRRGTGQVIIGNQNWASVIQGTTPDLEETRQWAAASGRWFTQEEVEGAAKVVLVGQTVVANLFGGGDPVGQVIRVRETPLTVIGVLERKGQSNWGQDQDDTVVIPLTTAKKRVLGPSHPRADSVNVITVRVRDGENMKAVEEEMRQLLRQRHRLQAYQEDDFWIRNLSEMLQAEEESSRILTMLLAAIASVSLLVGGIGIMNIMLVSVTERTREIGLRMAVGARGRDILTQFLVEAVTLSLIGGMIGIVLGVSGSYAIAYLAAWRTLINAQAILLAFCFSATVGIFFGFYPARKASLLNPIDALRYE